MQKSTAAVIAASSLVIGGILSGIILVRPTLAENDKLKRDRSGLSSQVGSLELQVKDLEAKVKRQAMGAIAYFDLRTSPNQRRDMEAKTVETLASLTEIFNDNKIDVQVLAPKGETTGLNKPVPSAQPSAAAPAAGASPGAPTPTPSPTGTPSGPPTEPPVQLTHKSFDFSVRGEYANLVRALTEIQGLPKAISINQYEIKLVKPPDEKGGDEEKEEEEDPSKPKVSDSLLELDFQISITYLMAGGLPPGTVTPGAPAGAPAPGVPGGSPSPKPISLELLHWALNWLGEPAWAAEVKPSKATRMRFAVLGLAAEGRDLVLRTERGTPRYRAGGSATRLVIELDEARVVEGAGLIGQAPGVRAVSVYPHPKRPGTAIVQVETDGTRFEVGLDQRMRLRLRARGGAPRFVAAPSALAKHEPQKPEKRKRTRPVVAIAGTPAGEAGQATVAPARQAAPAMPNRQVKAAKADPTSRRRIAAAPRTETADAATWSVLAQRAAAEWAARQGADREAFSPPVGPRLEPTGRPTAPAAVAGPAAGVRPTAVTKLAATTATVPAAHVERRAHAASAGPARLRAVELADGELRVRTEGKPAGFRLLGGDRRSVVLELRHTALPGNGRVFPIGEGGVERVRAALYDNHPPRVRLVVDTDGSVMVHPSLDVEGQLRLRLAPRTSSAPDVHLASVSTSGIVTTFKENPVTRAPETVRPRPVRTAAPRKTVVVPAARPSAPKRTVVHAPTPRIAQRRVAVRRPKPVAKPKPAPVAAVAPVEREVPPQGAAAWPTPSPTPMATPRDAKKPAGASAAPTTKPGGKPAVAAAATPQPTPTPEPTPEPTPTPPSLGRALTSTYRFPIDRSKVTGRNNPFKPIARPKGQFSRVKVPAAPAGGKNPLIMPEGVIGAIPGLDLPPPKPVPTPASPYVLGGVILGGDRPLALISIEGKAYTVGLKDTLPGNARVTAIKVDHVILSANGREHRLDLKR